MGTIVDGQQNSGDAGSIPTLQVTTAQATLDKLARGQAVIDARLKTQMTFLQVLEEYLLVELRTHYYRGNIDPYFIDVLSDTVLRRAADQAPTSFDPQQDAPYRWPGGADLGFSAERHDVIARALEGTASGFINHYDNYLRRHWALAGADVALEGIVQEKIDGHMAAIKEIFRAGQQAGTNVEVLRDKIEDAQQTWRRLSQVENLATARERRDLAVLARSQLPDWLRGMDKSDRETLRSLTEQVLQAQAQVDELLDGVASLEDFAAHLVKDYVRRNLDMEIEPDEIRVHVQWRTVMGQPMRTYRLSELMAGGPVRPDAVSIYLVENGAMLRNEPFAPTFIAQLLADVDVPANYLPALSSRYNRADLKDAMLDWFLARLQHSAFTARCAGHLTAAHHDDLALLWEHQSPRQAASGLQVCDVKLPNALKCADLLLFYREDPQGDVSQSWLYAPGKPDGQEWIVLASLRAVSAEIGLWTASEAGREYLLQQLSASDRTQGREYLIAVLAKPTSWDLSKDPRGMVSGFMACLEHAVLTGLGDNLLQVGLTESPHWYSTLPLDSRRSVSGLSHELLVHQHVFNEQLAGYEVFWDFAKRTVTQAIASYMQSKGVQGAVDPSTVLIDYQPGFTGERKVVSLLELAIYGYDDNWGIDHPKKGVRSSVGQDLAQVRSADLALYVRGAYLGERYAREVRAKFLDADALPYWKRRDACRYMLLAKMDRDLRIAYGQSALSADEFRWLTRQVTLLSDRTDAFTGTYASAVVEREGVLRFTVDGHGVLGVYVFACFKPKALYWLYTPDAPDGILFRSYLGFNGRTVAQLHDYVLERVALTARAKVGRSLLSLIAGTSRVDTLRELNRVIDLGAQFDTYIERAINDVEDVTTSRAQVIQRQVMKGLLFAAVPVCMIYPPFALLLDIVAIGNSSRLAIEAHAQRDTGAALEHWLAVTWGSLFAALGASGMTALLGRAAMNLKQVTEPLSLSAQRLRNVAAPARPKEIGPLVRSIRLKPKQAVKAAPDNLTLVVEDGIFHGTYRSLPSASQPWSAHYIRSRGRYFQVKKDPYFGGLCLMDASRPGALYKLPIRRMPDGRWAHNRVGLRGGDNGVRNLGRVEDLREAFAGHVYPVAKRGALQGEAVVAGFSEAATDPYLFSLNAQTCVIASLYNPTTKTGAVIHFDHNIRALIERSTRDVLSRLGGDPKDLRVTLVGGDWLTTSADIGGPVRTVMRAHGLHPSWDYWSYSSCFGNTYGVSLDLRSGITSVFKTSQHQVQSYYADVLARASSSSADRFLRRAQRFKNRYRSEPLMADAEGVVRTLGGRKATAAQLQLNEFATVEPS
jgi:hypothetical protein